jgi:rhamnogalacturonyl hydrolase YesR
MKKLLIVLVSVFTVFSSTYAQDIIPVSQKMANSQIQRSGFMSKWDYPNGLFAESLLKVYDLYKNDDYLNYVSRYADACINSSSGVIIYSCANT